MKEGADEAMWSNCLIEALKSKVINPRQVKVYKRGSWLSPWPHFYWYYKPDDKYYCFCGKEDNLSWLRQLWYEGKTINFSLKGG